jgi:ribosomal-protein-serine acetyltransferase
MNSFHLDDETELRQFVDTDAESVFKAVKENLEHLRPFMHWAVEDYSLQSAQEFIKQSAKGATERKSFGYGIFRHRKVIGSIGYVKFNWISKRTEIGYWIALDAEGRGLISRSCRLLIDYAFDELGMNRIEIRCAASNSRSRAIPERLGFLQEGILRQYELRNGVLHDFAVYGLLKSEWKRADK